MENDNAFRHELKYLISKQDMDCCIGRLAQFAKPDPHAKSGRYFVRSLYFDDMYASAYEDKESGVASRRKYRIRIYDFDESFIRLEKKIKEGSYVRKESAPLSRSEYDMILRGETDFLLERSERAACDFALGHRIDRLRPEVIVDYERVPFIYEYGDVRITFDMNIRSVFDELDVFAKDSPSYEVLGADQLVMEVKYTEFLPDIFRAILPGEGCRLAVSKYLMCDSVKRSVKEEIK